ncbi:betaine/proline/choline family ABC transporter ATP-binding protein [Epidermidibacterium keratini]|uniref:Betaine/proline/choline family ABC transporter ATP-binding protein n=1 Tax=Epidermidibacterium keratini TaxID=1891644 RepID=A0A7L4YTJ7_9ACTN|nr:betaine/proline/choline family ABC transporter ATP-binding protein [Epidermidibacterium keratini]
MFGRRESEALARLKDGASAEDVRKLGTPAVIDASFDVEDGEIFVVMGLSGSGKSTLIRMLNGLWKPTDGTVTVEGTDITNASDAKLREIRQQNVSMVFQHFALMPHRTVRDNAAYALEVKGVPRDQRLASADHWLSVVGLDGWGDRYPSQLSGGMQQRVGLARALAAETDILLMDEAFSALDPLIRREMQDQLIELQNNLGKTIVFITHDLNEAMYIGDRIAVMRDGRIVQVGTAEEILTDPANDYVAQFVQDVDRTRVLTARSVMEKPVSIVSSSAGPRTALEQMRKVLNAGALVVARDRTLLGYVSDDDMVAATRKGDTDLAPYLRQEALQTVAPDAPLVDLFAPSAGSPIPLAVVDDKNRLLGVIPRIALLASIASMTDKSSDVDAVNDDGTPFTSTQGPLTTGSIPVDTVTAGAGGEERNDGLA